MIKWWVLDEAGEPRAETMEAWLKWAAKSKDGRWVRTTITPDDCAGPVVELPTDGNWPFGMEVAVMPLADLKRLLARNDRLAILAMMANRAGDKECFCDCHQLPEDGVGIYGGLDRCCGPKCAQVAEDKARAALSAGAVSVLAECEGCGRWCIGSGGWPVTAHGVTSCSACGHTNCQRAVRK